MFKCFICNKEFKSVNGLSHHVIKTEKLYLEDYYNKYMKKDKDGICNVCGKETPFLSLSKGYQTHCCQSCAHLDKNVQNKYKQTMLNTYGVTNMFDKQEVQEKVHKVKFSEEKQNAARLRHLTKTGVEYATQTPEYINRVKEIRLRKIEEFEELNSCLLMKTIDGIVGGNIWKKHLDIPRLQLGRDKFVETKYLPQIIEYMEWFEENKYKGISAKEKEITDFIKLHYCGNILENSREIIPPYELDVYLPEIKLAIEFNGQRFHSHYFKSIDYHYNKSSMCRYKNIRLIHIYEFENIEEQKQLLLDLLTGIDNYPDNDYNKNNLLDGWEFIKPEIIYNNDYIVYGVEKLIPHKC